MSGETKKILLLLDVTFVEDSIVKEHLETCPSLRIEDNGAIMDPSKSPIINVDDENKEYKDDNRTVEKIVKPKNKAQSKFSAVVRNASSSDLRFPDRGHRESG